MDKGCPLCNGIITVEDRCPYCNNAMEDAGIIKDYYDPYSPYEEFNDVLQNEQADYCIHLVSCPSCGWDKRKMVKKIELPET